MRSTLCAVSDYQPPLFSASELKGCYAVTPPVGSDLSPAALTDWKQRIWQYQQQVRLQIPMQQASLFEPEISLDPEVT